MTELTVILRDRLSQFAYDIRQLDARIDKLEEHVRELRVVREQVRHETTLENLAIRGAEYRPIR